MEACSPTRVLAGGCVIGLCTVLLTRMYLPLGAVWAAACTLLALRRVLANAGLAALPALLASITGPVERAVPLPVGPLRLHGTVALVREDPRARELEVWLRWPSGLQRLRVTGDLRLLPGDRLSALAGCSPPAVAGNPSHLHADAAACRVVAGHPSLPRLFAWLRFELHASLLQLVDGDAGLLLCSLVLGGTVDLPSELVAAHRATGLSHLLAVSGAHAAMLAWLLGLHTWGQRRRRRIGRLHLGLAMLALGSYGAITGFEPPVFRAVLSYALAALGSMHGRQLGIVQALAWPALASALAAPAGMASASFWLSYAAVVGLALAGPARDERAIERWLWAPMRASFWATAMTAPITLAWFGQVAPWTVLLTPLLVPLVSACLLLGLATPIVAAVSPALAHVLAWPLAGLANAYAAAVTLADELPLTPLFAATTPTWPLSVAAGAAALLLVLAVRSRAAVLAALGLGMLPHFLPLGAPGPARLLLFAVGHGQACLLQFGDGGTVLVDCGSLQHAVLPARKVEQSLGRRRCIDLLVVTHGDHDHTGSIDELLRRLPVQAAVLPAGMRGHRVATLLSAHGCAVRWLPPGARCEPVRGCAIAAPRLDPAVASSNDLSLWVTAQLDSVRVVLPGDAEQAGVTAALQDGTAQPADVLLLPHHGRDNPAIRRLLELVQPRLCLASNRNGEGQSAQGDVAVALGIPTFATGDAGDLELSGGPDARLRCAGGLPLPVRTAGASALRAR